MFNRKRPYKPVKPKGAGEIGSSGRIAFSNADRTWEESYDLVEILENALRNLELSCERKGDWLVVSNDLYLCPNIAAFNPIHPSGVRTTTTICVAHEKYAPNGLFEYQHAQGDDVNSALAAGVNNWIELDLPVLLDAINNSLETCDALDFGPQDSSGYVRRALLGPVLHLADSDIEVDEEHPFCPCCLFTNSFEAFEQQRNGEGLYGIRLLALRDQDGELSADCRVNGIDWELGKEQLKKYAESWAGSGFEMRKQYVVIYTADTNSE